MKAALGTLGRKLFGGLLTKTPSMPLVGDRGNRPIPPFECTKHLDHMTTVWIPRGEGGYTFSQWNSIFTVLVDTIRIGILADEPDENSTGFWAHIYHINVDGSPEEIYSPFGGTEALSQEQCGMFGEHLLVQFRYECTVYCRLRTHERIPRDLVLHRPPADGSRVYQNGHDAALKQGRLVIIPAA